MDSMDLKEYEGSLADLTINVIIQSKYGKNYFYPDNKPAKVLTMLLGRLSLTKEQLKFLKGCGCTVNIKVEDYQLD